MKRNITFGNNLKNYRENKGLTQKQLAESIGYTEKSVSKWETESGFPTVETLVLLSETLGVSLDELVFEKISSHYFLGIDGGGTKTVFKLVNENGETVSTIIKGSANPNDIGMNNTLSLLKEGIKEVSKGIPYGNITMFAGISGGGLTSDNASVLHRFFGEFGFFAFDNGSDIENLITLAEHKNCILVIMGTGSIVYLLNGNTRKRIGGWGQFFDQGGSGYTIGRDAITAALRDADGSGEKTLLSSLIKEKAGETAEEHLSKFYEGGKRYVASFSDLVFKAAKKGDKVSQGILDKNMKFISDLIATALNESDKKDIPVFLSGGLSRDEKVLFPLIKKHLQRNAGLIRIKEDQIDGAVKRAKALYNEKRGQTE